MVMLGKAEIVDFLNEKADTITNFVQAQEELSNVENVRFSVEGEFGSAFCYIQFNEFIHSYNKNQLQWVFRNLGIELFMAPESAGVNELQFCVESFHAQPVVVRRNYDVLVAEGAIRLIEERATHTRNACYEIDEDFEGHTAQTVIEMSKDECNSDIIHGCEFDADLSPSIINI